MALNKRLHRVRQHSLNCDVVGQLEVLNFCRCAVLEFDASNRLTGKRLHVDESVISQVPARNYMIEYLFVDDSIIPAQHDKLELWMNFIDDCDIVSPDCILVRVASRDDVRGWLGGIRLSHPAFERSSALGYQLAELCQASIAQFHGTVVEQFTLVPNFEIFLSVNVRV